MQATTRNSDSRHRQKTDLPLSGVRVLDLSRVLAGPLCAMALGDLGAEVIKVEHPLRGDDTRDWGTKIGKSNTPYFNGANRNKTSVGVDLKTPEGREIIRELVLRSDVIVQNFKFGAMGAMGLDYESLKKINPSLIYCSISGYATDGIEANRPGYDLVVQGEAGLMAINGDEGQGPLKFGAAVVDMFTGMYSAQAVLAALYERSSTNLGRHVELALFDCGLMISAFHGMEALLRGAELTKYGNSNPTIIPYGVFNAADGPLVITVGNNAQFKRFCVDVIGRSDLANDVCFQTSASRAANRATLMPELEREIASRPRSELLHRLSVAEIPCGEVLGLLEAMQSPRAIDTGMVSADPADGSPLLASPYRIDGVRMPVRVLPPKLGQHTEDVLRELLQMDEQAISSCRDAGAI